MFPTIEVMDGYLLRISSDLSRLSSEMVNGMCHNVHPVKRHTLREAAVAVAAAAANARATK